ncbi:hypothetical protein WR25_01212 [Diploscapter pachys]|uniref:Uncharacterized protein n=1 Tax=Diploscapter pachys TaxID=2018661 RepID=A0A2A2M171_9BILA|nr:hypothetical protein WR25_01212 [Diploscapter pachys]
MELAAMAGRMDAMPPPALLTPGLDGFSAVLGFPRLEDGVIPALGLDQFAVMRVLVGLYFTWLTSRFLLRNWSSSTTASLRIKNVDHLPQAVTILTKQATKFVFKLHFSLNGTVIFHRFQFCELLSKLEFKAAEFGETRHGDVFLGEL